MSVLTLQNISKIHGAREEFQVLSGLCLSVKDSEVVAIIGPSGCGKSTLLSICGLIDFPSSGEISLQDISCIDLSDDQLATMRRKFIGYIYQFHHLLPEFTALENLIIPQFIVGRRREVAIDKAKDILGVFGLYDKENRLPSELSGGEQQRVAIARSLINNPKLILADEPTGNLDPENALKAINIIIEQVKVREMSALIVTHNLDLAAKCDRILILDHGKLKPYK